MNAPDKVPEEPTPSSLNLDARQRAMLKEMGVVFWWPEASDPVLPAIEPEPPAATVELRAEPVAAPVPVPESVAPARRPGAVDRMSWDELQLAVAGCQACRLCEQRRNTVFGVGPASEAGPPRVDWLIVGEAPGENEDRLGEPFVGQAGKLLDNMLRALGLSRSGQAPLAGAYIANVIKCRPPGNRNPEPDEVAQCQPFLQRQIALLQPRIIVALGRFAVQTLLQGSVPQVETLALGKLRGKVYQYQGVPVVVSYHPAYLLRNLPDKAKAWSDLCLALRVMQSGAASGDGRPEHAPA